MTLRAYSALVLLVIAGIGCSRSKELESSSPPEPFTFTFVSAPASDGGQLLEAAVAPEGENVPTTFRLWLARPGMAARAGDMVQGVMRRGEPGGTSYLLVTLAPAFFDAPASSSSSGGLVAIDVKLEAVDSLPLALTIRSSSRSGAWLADARLANGGRFAVALDSLTKRGEFRRVDGIGDSRVFAAILGLLGPR